MTVWQVTCILNRRLAKTRSASFPDKFCATIYKDQQIFLVDCTPGVKSAIYNCLVCVVDATASLWWWYQHPQQQQLSLTQKSADTFNCLSVALLRETNSISSLEEHSKNVFTTSALFFPGLAKVCTSLLALTEKQKIWKSQKFSFFSSLLNFATIFLRANFTNAGDSNRRFSSHLNSS